MSRQIIIKDSNTIAVWSTIVDNFVFEGTLKDYKRVRAERASYQVREEIDKIYNDLNNGLKPYYQFQMTYEEACQTRDEVHGEKEDKTFHKI